MKMILAAGTAMLALIAFPAQAQEAGTIEARLLATAVIADGQISQANILGPVPATTQTEANENYVPTLAIEYYLTPNISIETICCVSQHDVDAVAGPLAGAELVSDAKVVPATFTLKYHFDAGAVQPYIGAGPTYFIWIDEQPGAATIPLGITDFSMTDEFGVAVQAGVDVELGDSGFLLNLDAKRYWVGTTARWYAGNALTIETEHDINPWVLSAGVGLRF